MHHPVHAVAHLSQVADLRFDESAWVERLTSAERVPHPADVELEVYEDRNPVAVQERALTAIQGSPGPQHHLRVEADNLASAEAVEEGSGLVAACSVADAGAGALLDDLPGLGFFFSCSNRLTASTSRTTRNTKYFFELNVHIQGFLHAESCNIEPHILKPFQRGEKLEDGLVVVEFGQK